MAGSALTRPSGVPGAVVWPGELVVVTRRRRSREDADKLARVALEARLAALAAAAGAGERKRPPADLEREVVEARLRALEAAVAAAQRDRDDEGNGR